jgi:hypothetical protein
MSVRKEITPEFFQFTDKGQEVEGKYAGYGEIQINGVTVRKHAIQRTSDGKVINFLGGVQLDQILSTVKDGGEIALVYDGRTTIAKGFQVKKFKLFSIEPGTESKPPAKK